MLNGDAFSDVPYGTQKGLRGVMLDDGGPGYPLVYFPKLGQRWVHEDYLEDSRAVVRWLSRGLWRVRSFLKPQGNRL